MEDAHLQGRLIAFYFVFVLNYKQIESMRHRRHGFDTSEMIWREFLAHRELNSYSLCCISALICFPSSSFPVHNRRALLTEELHTHCESNFWAWWVTEAPQIRSLHPKNTTCLFISNILKDLVKVNRNHFISPSTSLEELCSFPIMFSNFFKKPQYNNFQFVLVIFSFRETWTCWSLSQNLTVCLYLNYTCNRCY